MKNERLQHEESYIWFKNKFKYITNQNILMSKLFLHFLFYISTLKLFFKILQISVEQRCISKQSSRCLFEQWSFYITENGNESITFLLQFSASHAKGLKVILHSWPLSWVALILTFRKLGMTQTSRILAFAFQVLFSKNLPGLRSTRSFRQKGFVNVEL